MENPETLAELATQDIKRSQNKKLRKNNTTLKR
jgi:hypothetical protein